MCYTGIINDDDIVQQRITGKSARDRQGQGNPLADVNCALDLFTGATFNDKVRKHTLASSAPDLMNCRKSYTRGPSKADVASAQLLTEIIWRRCVMLGLHAPQTAVLRLSKLRRRKRQALTAPRPRSMRCRPTRAAKPTSQGVRPVQFAQQGRVPAAREAHEPPPPPVPS